MKPVKALWLAIFLLAACATGPSPSVTVSALASRHFSGVYVNGWEAQIFVENGHQSEQSYWVQMTPAASAAIAAVLPAADAPGEAARVVVDFDGRLSPRGRYGHLGAFPYTVLIEHVTSARLERAPLPATSH